MKNRSSDVSVYGVIMAGGIGKRLWPVSNPKKPKQFINFDGKSLLRRTYERIEPLIGADRTIVVTNKDMGKLVSSDLPELPEENIIEEPYRRNTAPCIGLSALIGQKKLGLSSENSVMAVLPADHLITEKDKFLSSIKEAIEVAKKGKSLVTLGIQPTGPRTGYGYIEAGEKEGTGAAREVLNFTEKPDRRTAEKFLSEGNYFWNSGMFVWRTDVLLEEIEKDLPSLSASLGRIKSALNTESETEIIDEEYEKMNSVSIDYGVMEKARDRSVVPASFNWNDVGSWSSLKPLLGEDEEGNSARGEVELKETEESVVFNDADKKILAFGVENLVIAESEDALLVMDKAKAEDLKEIL